MAPGAAGTIPPARPSEIGSLSSSGIFWRTVSPESMAAIDRHNARIGARLQSAVQQLLLVYLAGPLIYLAVRLAFRIRLVGQDILRENFDRAIYAFRHYYEWDPFVPWFAAFWRVALLRPHLHPKTLAGHFWIKTRIRRAFSYLAGVLAVTHGAGRNQSGLGRASELLSGGRPVTIAIAPTGPIRESRSYEVKPGVAWLALDNPDVPVIPVDVVGLQGVRPGLSLFWRRPVVMVALGRPFCGRDATGAREEERISHICERIREAWERAEAKVGAL